MICVPITETAADAFLNAITDAAQSTDIIELRLDYLDAADCQTVLETLTQLVAEKPLLLTFRPREQGGRRDLSLQDRQNFWRNLPPEVIRTIRFADFEFDLVESFADDSPVPWEKVICSWHNFDKTPDDLIQHYDRMAATPAAVVKIATMANRINDSLRLFELLNYAQGKKPVIALAMSLAGIATRILSPSRGGVLTFGSLRRGAESAAGQPTATELRNLYRINQLTRDSEIYGVIGNPVGHSRSPLMHNAALAAFGRNGVYLPLEVTDIESFARELLHPKTKRLDWNLRGLSVTIPHKLAIMPFLDWIDPTAQTIGAINTVVVEGEELHGYNTDVIGAMKPLEALLDLRGARAAVLGAGGSARAICHGLRERGAEVTIYSRDLGKAAPLAEEFDAKTALLEAFAGDADLVINCTPIGMHGHSEGQSLLRADSLRQVKLVYDLIYTPEETALLSEAKAAGCQTLGGLAMLVGQAMEQFRLWTGAEAPSELMKQALNLPART
ncbi:MAG TPA: shikimate dehydrogenase [Blastocatellia bacterium]|nr:shikimate dehydrogenase [Blastocatellia bacterium]HMV86638.1 shikimate dehydrogenase [Blastocatellia bacterium]HMX27016.1 shikimate dehydrogenase [Blastocatellia bacterium]HMY71203.1 shikimate dehydrogenase [Blastocatellia bacterium]HMZ20765.1 shikimate dehydrogenase [Blastocatellia bacterium]